MATLKIDVSDSLDAFLGQEAAARGFDSPSAYVEDLIRKDRDRAALRRKLLEGAESEPAEPADERYFAELRARARAGGRATGSDR